jgi:hypothetical protein
VVYDVHEDVPRQILSKDHIFVLIRKPVSALIEAIEAFSAKRFDGVVTATPFINKRFIELGANAVNVNNYPITSELSSRKRRWVRKEKSVFYIGGISRIRGVFEMVEAIGKTPYKLFLAGNLESGIKNRLVHLPGWRQVDREGAKATATRSMAGLVLFHPEPNHIDAQPNKMFDYMSAGIPVVASNFPLWKKIIDGAECGICVDPLNPEEIASAIRWIIIHLSEAKRMGENGRRAVEEKYNWDKESEKLLSFYNNFYDLRA